MPNEKNLIPTNKRTKSEVRELGKKGGKKSGEARRKKRLLKDCMKELLDLPVEKTSAKELKKLGMDVSNIDNRVLLVAALFTKATKRYDVAAFKEIRNLMGESDDSNTNTGKFEKLMEGLKDE